MLQIISVQYTYFYQTSRVVKILWVCFFCPVTTKKIKCMSWIVKRSKIEDLVEVSKIKLYVYNIHMYTIKCISLHKSCY